MQSLPILLQPGEISIAVTQSSILHSPQTHGMHWYDSIKMTRGSLIHRQNMLGMIAQDQNKCEALFPLVTSNISREQLCRPNTRVLDDKLLHAVDMDCKWMMQHAGWVIKCHEQQSSWNGGRWLYKWGLTEVNKNSKWHHTKESNPRWPMEFG